MNLVQRAVTNIAKNIEKSLTLFAIIFILGVVISGAISVNQAIESVDLNLRGEIPPVAIVEMDIKAMEEYEAANGFWPEIPIGLSPEILGEIGTLPYVRQFDYSLEAWHLTSNSLERYIPEGGLPFIVEEEAEWRHFSLKGVRSTQLFELEEGIIELSAGRMLADEEVSTLTYVALISENFARLNNLHIGSNFTLQNIILDMRDTDIYDVSRYSNPEDVFARRSYEFEVVGIFTSNLAFDTGDEWADAHFQEQMENRIYVPNSVSLAAAVYQIEQSIAMNPKGLNLEENPEDMLWFQNIYVLHDPAYMDNFETATLEIIPEFHTVTNTSNAYDRIASSMESLGGLSIGILWGAIVASTIILSLLVTLLMRERRREMGILLALGEQKRRIIVQSVLEVLVIAIVALSLSLLVGNFISSGISEYMLRNNLIADLAGDAGMSFSNLDFMGFSNNVPLEEIMATYDTSLSARTITAFYLATTATVLLSTIIPMLYILRLNPRKIMM
ncbi:MAG: ABC transporter permease [Coriobacteriia bacterium]|nr:ABC transporter permease [Coriobacteriia bacterium]